MANNDAQGTPPREQIESIVQAAVRSAINKYQGKLDSNENSAMMASLLDQLADVDETVRNITDSLEVHLNTELHNLKEGLWQAFDEQVRQNEDHLAGRIQSMEDGLTRDVREDYETQQKKFGKAFEQQIAAFNKQIRETIVKKGVDQKLVKITEKQVNLDRQVQIHHDKIKQGEKHQNKTQAQLNEHERLLKLQTKLSKDVGQLQRDKLELQSRIARLEGKSGIKSAPINPTKDIRAGDFEDESMASQDEQTPNANIDRVPIDSNASEEKFQWPPWLQLSTGRLIALVAVAVVTAILVSKIRPGGPTPPTDLPAKPGVEEEQAATVPVTKQCLGTIAIEEQDTDFINETDNYVLAGAIFGRDAFTRVDEISRLAQYVQDANPTEEDTTTDINLPDFSFAKETKLNLKLGYLSNGRVDYDWAKNVFRGEAKNKPTRKEMYHLWFQLALRDGGAQSISWDIGVLSSKHGDTLKRLIKKVQGRFKLAEFNGLMDLVANGASASGPETEKVLGAVFVGWSKEAYTKQINALAKALAENPDAAEVDLSGAFSNNRLHAVLCKDGDPTALGQQLATHASDEEKIKNDHVLLQLWLASRFGILRFDGDPKELQSILSLFVARNTDGSIQTDIAGQKRVMKTLIEKAALFGAVNPERINTRIEEAFAGGGQ